MTTPTSLQVRFWRQVQVASDDACWEWAGCRRPDGYGVVSEGRRAGRILRAHRVAYELLVGRIPDGLVLDHLCNNRGCVNPYHLEPVTSEENSRRGTARREHCRRGHEFTPENTIIRPLGRECRTCRRARKARNRTTT